MKVAVVVPTYRKELFDKFYEAWDWESDSYDINLYIVEDNPKKTFKTPKDDWVAAHYCWKDIDKDLGKEVSWVISRRSSAIRSYGYLKAYQEGCDYILTLDDDCYPLGEDNKIESLIASHMRSFKALRPYSSYFDVGGFFFPDYKLWMRGSPVRYRAPRKAFVSAGGWAGNPDLDAWTQLQFQHVKVGAPQKACVNVPRRSGLTLCGMNVMFHRSVIPIAYFLLQGASWGVDRVDDIWAGLFMKRVMDELDLPIAINGFASVYHDRASNALTSLKKEGVTLQETELLWDRLMTLNLEGDSLVELYCDMCNKCEPTWFGTEFYGVKLLEAMKKWVSLFKK